MSISVLSGPENRGRGIQIIKQSQNDNQTGVEHEQTSAARANTELQNTDSGQGQTQAGSIKDKSTEEQSNKPNRVKHRIVIEH